MNPSHFPQVLRGSRSRSPSPVSRRRVHSDVGSPVPEHEFPGLMTVGENLLSVPDVEVGGGRCGRQRSRSDNVVRPSQHTPGRRGVTAELENMANVEVVNGYHSINDNDHTCHLASHGEEEGANDPDPDRIYTTQHCFVDSCPGHCDGMDARSRSRTYGGTEQNPETHDSKKCSGCFTPDQVDQLRRRVKFFFMDPFSKFKARRHLPWKMGLQFLKIVILTIQLVQFGYQRGEVVEFFERSQKALSHLMLKDWDPSYETMPYPPATGTYALYSVDALLDHIDYAWGQYHNLSHRALAYVTLLKDNKTKMDVPIRMCTRFNNYTDFNNGSYLVMSGVGHNCTDLDPLAGPKKYDIRTYLTQHNISIPFKKLLDLTLEFPFKTFHLNLIETHYGPTCYNVNATIKFTNQEQSGQILIALLLHNSERKCVGKIMSLDAKAEELDSQRRSVAVDSVVIIVCSLSTVLCIRSLVRSFKLKRRVEQMFKTRYGKTLSMSDRMEFVNLWYFLLIVNDIFTLAGSAYKIQLETRTVTITSFKYDLCSLMLGLGGLLAWIGCLRYLNFFKTCNILILTLKTAFPNMLRFMVCALTIYFGFMFCGWVVLGPYHIKFRQLSTTSECLYSLVNGDDMFVTFSATVTDNIWVWYFSRAYLYIFISLFIYCVLSLFISVIMDTYETLKEYNEKGFPKTELQKFVEQCHDPIQSGLYRRQHTENKASDFSLIDCLASCCQRRNKHVHDAGERSRLLTRTI
ncbi:mucolipin-3-like isoform X2 [Littorina saxatilis]|uniref:Uncharacterized protein n=1 Tax=Littorina saxatilis TaxID=31220 RepID=A0AAN9B8M5_9CAEN